MVYQLFVYVEEFRNFQGHLYFFHHIINRKNIKFQVKKVLSHIDVS